MQPERPDLVRAEHCHVLDVAVWGNVPHPGLLLEWRESEDGWEGLVVAVESYSGGWQVRQRWVAAEMIQRVVSDEA